MTMKHQHDTSQSLTSFWRSMYTPLASNSDTHFPFPSPAAIIRAVLPPYIQERKVVRVLDKRPLSPKMTMKHQHDTSQSLTSFWRSMYTPLASNSDTHFPFPSPAAIISAEKPSYIQDGKVEGLLDKRPLSPKLMGTHQYVTPQSPTLSLRSMPAPSASNSDTHSPFPISAARIRAV